MTFRRDPFGELWTEVNRIQDEFNRMFHARPAAPAAGSGLPLNVWQDDHNLYVEADLPAVDPATLDISLAEGNELTLQGERKAPEVPGGVWVRQERPHGRFTRVVTLPVLVDADRVQARYENGVLKLTLPKSEAAKPRKITVQA